MKLPLLLSHFLLKVVFHKLLSSDVHVQVLQSVTKAACLLAEL